MGRKNLVFLQNLYNLFVTRERLSSLLFFLSLGLLLLASHRPSLYIFLLGAFTENPNLRPCSSHKKGESMAWDGGVHPDCPNATNPFHICAEYCPHGPLPRSKNPANKEILVSNGLSSKENGEKVEGGRRRTVDPLCVNASNPFHQCSDNCVRRKHDGKSPLKGTITGGRKDKVVISENRKVNTSCPNASNPFHQCAEYCSKRSEGAGQVKRGNSGGSSSKKGLVVAERKDVNPSCPNASNPFHKCTEHCSQTRKSNGAS
ncbi:uncharacterized protein LOC110102095 isoform X2 [Dendrobium catenatum]|nr:uncharacterized protein LOC110102095 isoform X2 [Dendrobium catenatum]